ncbi:hypothetical protein P8452_64840 [Trifolium repens]|nr:hypothetical protein P8452_64840 [Trifolium repens]
MPKGVGSQLEKIRPAANFWVSPSTLQWVRELLQVLFVLKISNWLRRTIALNIIVSLTSHGFDRLQRRQGVYSIRPAITPSRVWQINGVLVESVGTRDMDGGGSGRGSFGSNFLLSSFHCLLPSKYQLIVICFSI